MARERSSTILEKTELIFDGKNLGDGSLFHYTDSRAFLGIIKENKVWATSYQSLEDTTEHSYGHVVVKGVLKDLIEESKNPLLTSLYQFRFEHNILAETFGRHYYIFCLVEDGDSQHHWENYGNGGGGFAVQFRLDEKFKETPECIEGHIPHKLMKVIYDPSEQRRVAREVLLEIADLVDYGISEIMSLGFLLEYLCIKFKDPKYAVEKEWRIVYSPITNVGYLGENIDFRESSKGIIHYNIFQPDTIIGATIGPVRLGNEFVSISEMFISYLKIFPANVQSSKLGA